MTKDNVVQLETVKAAIAEILDAASAANNENKLKGVLLFVFDKENRFEWHANLQNFQGPDQYIPLGVLSQFVQDFGNCIVQDESLEEEE